MFFVAFLTFGPINPNIHHQPHLPLWFVGETAVFPSCHFEHPFASVGAITFSGAYGLPSHTVVAIDILYSVWHENTFALTRSAGQDSTAYSLTLELSTCLTSLRCHPLTLRVKWLPLNPQIYNHLKPTPCYQHKRLHYQPTLETN